MDILDRITNELVRQNKQQQELTNYLGAKKTLYSDWKSGKNKSYQNLKHLVKIADYLNVSLDYLVFGKGEKTSLAQNDKEQECLNTFNELSKDDQTLAIGFMKGLAAKYDHEVEAKENAS